MVNPHRHSSGRKAMHKERRDAEKKRRKQNDKGTQWCSGITCVLAGLRAHYPEHQRKRRREEKEEEEKTGKTSNETMPPSHAVIPQSTMHTT